MKLNLFKEKFTELKNKYFTKENIIKMYFVTFLLVFCLFVYFNQYSIQFYYNGFEKIASSDLQVYFLDVGQANSTLIVFPSKLAMLVDAGSQESAKGLSEDVKYILKKNDINKIEYLMLTHSDEDHIGGAISILENFEVSNILRPKVYAPSETQERNYNVVETTIYQKVIDAVYKEVNCKVEFIEDDFMKFGNVEVEIFSCQKDKYSGTNSYSPFVLIESGETSILLTGDATETREKEFVSYLNANNRILNIDYLLVSHHGSAYSTMEEFLDATSPQYAIVSAGNLVYPTIEVKQRLQACGVEGIYITYNTGTIGLGSTDGKIYFNTMSKNFDVALLVVCTTIVCFVCVKFLPLRKTKIKLFRRKVF